MQSLCRRPTFLPSMKLKPLPSDWLAKDPKRAMLKAYVNALGDLAGPKRSLPMLQDKARLDAYAAGIRNALLQRPGGQLPHIVAGSQEITHLKLFTASFGSMRSKESCAMPFTLVGCTPGIISLFH